MVCWMNIQKSNLDNTFEQQKHDDTTKQAQNPFTKTKRIVSKTLKLVDVWELTFFFHKKKHRHNTLTKKHPCSKSWNIHHHHTHILKVGCCRVRRNFDVHQLNNYAKCVWSLIWHNPKFDFKMGDHVKTFGHEINTMVLTMHKLLANGILGLQLALFTGCDGSYHLHHLILVFIQFYK